MRGYRQQCSASECFHGLETAHPHRPEHRVKTDCEQETTPLLPARIVQKETASSQVAWLI